jgi:hypothetical protein
MAGKINQRAGAFGQIARVHSTQTVVRKRRKRCSTPGKYSETSSWDKTIPRS